MVLSADFISPVGSIVEYFDFDTLAFRKVLDHRRLRLTKHEPFEVQHQPVGTSLNDLEVSANFCRDHLRCVNQPIKPILFLRPGW